MTPFLWGKNNSNSNVFLIRNHGGQKEVMQYFASVEIIVRPQSYMQQKYSSGIKGKSRHSQIKEN